MIRSQLNSYSGSDPIWGFVALLGNERFTGEAAVGLDPRVRLFAVDGRVYFAEREGDAPVSARLVNCGAVTTTQLEHGAVRIGDTTSLARLFQREPSIDRDAVELTIETATEALLESIANKPVGMPEVFPLRHHSSGIHHWLRTTQQPGPFALLAPAREAPVAVATAEAEPEVQVDVEVAPVAAISVVEEYPLAAVEVEAVAPAAVEVEVEAVAPEALTPEPPLHVEPVATLAPILHEWPLTPVVPQHSVDPIDSEPAVVEEPTFVATPEPAPQADLGEHLWGDSFSSHTAPLQPAPFTELAPLYEAPVVFEPLVAEPSAIELPVIEPPVIEAPVIEAPSSDVPWNIEEPAAFVEPSPVPHVNGFTLLPTLGSLSSHEATTPARLHDALATTESAANEPAATEPVVERAPDPHVMPTLGSLSSLTSLNSQLHPDTSDPTPAAGASATDFFDALDIHSAPVSDLPSMTAEHATYEPGPATADLPKLASTPISMEALMALDSAGSNEVGPWNGATHNNAAVEIWEMIDSLDGPKPSEDQLVTTGTEKRSRGWLRGRKG